MELGVEQGRFERRFSPCVREPVVPIEGLEQARLTGRRLPVRALLVMGLAHMRLLLARLARNGLLVGLLVVRIDLGWAMASSEVASCEETCGASCEAPGRGVGERELATPCERSSCEEPRAGEYERNSTSVCESLGAAIRQPSPSTRYMKRFMGRGQGQVDEALETGDGQQTIQGCQVGDWEVTA